MRTNMLETKINVKVIQLISDVIIGNRSSEGTQNRPKPPFRSLTCRALSWHFGTFDDDVMRSEFYECISCYHGYGGPFVPGIKPSGHGILR